MNLNIKYSYTKINQTPHLYITVNFLHRQNEMSHWILYFHYWILACTYPPSKNGRIKTKKRMCFISSFMNQVSFTYIHCLSLLSLIIVTLSSSSFFMLCVHVHTHLIVFNLGCLTEHGWNTVYLQQGILLIMPTTEESDTPPASVNGL